MTTSTVETLREGLAQGSLQIGQIVGLTDREVAVMSEEADYLQERGHLDRAQATYALLLQFDPFRSELWRASAALLRRRGEPEAAQAAELAADLLSADEQREVAP